MGRPGILDGLMGHGSVVDSAKLAKHMDGILIEGETVRMAYRVIRDFFVFTQKRLILVDIQLMTGSKVDSYHTEQSYASLWRRPEPSTIKGNINRSGRIYNMPGSRGLSGCKDRPGAPASRGSAPGMRRLPLGGERCEGKNGVSSSRLDAGG